MIFGKDVTGVTLASAISGVNAQPIAMKPAIETQTAHRPALSIWNPY
jgi:hypothetical protein